MQCGTVARIVSSKDDRSICDACYGRDPERHEPCAGCGKRRRVAHRDEHGRPRCVRCYPRPKRPCSTCGQVAETTAFTDAPGQSAHAVTQPLSSPSGNADAADGSGRSAGTPPTTRQTCATHATPAHRTPAPDAAGSPRERDTRTAYRSARAATSARSSLRLLRRAWTHHRTVAGGAVCSACYPRVRAKPRTCPGCGQSRTLNAIDQYAQPVCAECAGSGTSYRCMRCGGPSDGYVRETDAPRARCVITWTFC